MSQCKARRISICIGLVMWGCTVAPTPPTMPGGSQEVLPAPIDTAPPPILYPPRDPAATYPVIRTWQEVLTFEPHGYLEPVPIAQSTEIDGVYGKLDPGEPQWWRCARCPDFRLAGGNWRLMLHQGTMRMYYEVTGFSTVGSYEVQGDMVKLFNDPHCPYETGEYTWNTTGAELTLIEIHDPCAIHLRAENLTRQPWRSCQPPNHEAGATDHWIRPPACG